MIILWCVVVRFYTVFVFILLCLFINIAFIQCICLLVRLNLIIAITLMAITHFLWPFVFFFHYMVRILARYATLNEGFDQRH